MIKQKALHLLTILLLTACLIMLSFFAFQNLTKAEESPTPSLIKIDDSMLTDENIYKYHDTKLIHKIGVLFNRQSELPHAPLSEKDFPNAQQFMSDPSWKPNFSPIKPISSAIIDLGTQYIITAAYAFDTNGNQLFVLSSGEPFSWKTQSETVLKKYMGWTKLEITENFATRYIHIQSNLDSGLNELAIYGYKSDNHANPIIIQAPKQKPLTTATAAFGVNAFVDDPLHVTKVGGHIREFHNISFTTAGDKSAFSPSANNAWDFDAYYKSLYDKNIDVVPCIQGTTTAISGDNILDFSGNEKPMAQGANPLLPASYKVHSEIMFNYAARYGSVSVDHSRLKLTANQTPKTGLGYIKYYENFNEPNKDWEGEKSYFTPYEFAAMCSADYDGHESTIGKNSGIKNADNNAKLVMGGLVGRNVIEYVSLMKLWFEHNRQDKLFAVDVINIHSYQTTQIVENANTNKTISDLKAWIDKNVPGTELWVTEFGPEIPLTEIADRASAEYYEAKANGTVRTFLDGYAAGADRMTMFMIRDTDGGVYSTDGLTTMKGEWSPKPSWHYMAATRAALGDVYFDSLNISGETYTYKFKNNEKTVYAVLNKSLSGVSTVDLPVDTAKTAHLTSLADSYAEGLTQVIPITTSIITVQATQRPVFVTLFNMPDVKQGFTKLLVKPIRIIGDDATIKKVEVMFDESFRAPITPTAKIRSPLTGVPFEDYSKNQDYIDSKPNNPENSLYPITAIIDLGKDYYITDIGFYDSNSSGELRISALSRGEYTSLVSYPCTSYNMWVVKESSRNIKTRYLKLEKFTSASVYEIALYGYSLN